MATSPEMTSQPVQPGLQPQPKDESRKEDVKKEQDKLGELKGGSRDYFEQVAEHAQAFEDHEGEDSFRRAARIEREQMAMSAKGDPTRDPVAKQEAMDKNTVLPGAKEDAEKIKKEGSTEGSDKTKV